MENIEEQKKELAKAYDPKPVESKWYTFWEEGSFFKASANTSKPPYCISIPPPNVTGVLHMGHALVDTLQDVLTRWKRMLGYEALWVPGTDHAGISTQTVVERHLIATLGKTRKEFSREEFLGHVWKWKQESEDQILRQLKKLGCSCDWSRLCFTMDAPRNRAVRTMFKKMFDAGLIYRGDYLVNWDPVTQTALADDEVEYEERASFLWYLRYPVEDGKGQYLVVATTRPETLLGDTAVAVSPSDIRYFPLIGKKLLHPLTGRTIPVIADHAVDPSFGSGAVKITPAHDPNDYQMALRHHLPMINIMTPDGKINEEGGAFCGMTMEEARKAVIERMQALHLIERIEPHTLRVGVSYRSKAVIEPYLSKQWFVKMSAFKEKLISAVRDKRVRLIPEHWENTYFHWIENLRDWCISRQLWWGHRIPIWYHKSDESRMVCYEGEGLPSEVAASPEEWRQDEDVLDTWFSSALWPFSVLGWPDNTEDLRTFYPNATLITGHDILFFWVARMIMMGEYALGKPPFPESFLHGLIYGKSYWRQQKEGGISYIMGEQRVAYDLGEPLPADVHFKWEKMSKSKGNILDPLEIIEVYGTDAMRMALCASATQARQIDLDRRRFEEFKNFANKIWNGARFAFMHIQELTAEELEKGLDVKELTLEDEWILSVLHRTIRSVNQNLERYCFDHAAMAAYDFFWKEFCAYYLEISKPYLFSKMGTEVHRANKRKLLLIVLSNAIRLMHPMAPFITEELFSTIKSTFDGCSPTEARDPYTREMLASLKAAACIVAPYPRLDERAISESVEANFALIDQIVHAVRTIRAEMQLPPSAATDLYIVYEEGYPLVSTIQKHFDIVRSLLRLNTVHFSSQAPKAALSAETFVQGFKLIVPLPAELIEREKGRLTKEKEKLILQQNSLRGKLANEGFMQKAPTEIVEKMQTQLGEIEAQLLSITKKLSSY